MKLLLYEWCTAGGLVDTAGAPSDSGIRTEGWLMAHAVGNDVARDADLQVEVLVDATCPLDLPPGMTVRAVPPGEEVACLLAASAAADWTLLIAPETDGILADRVARCRAAGGRVLAGDPAFIAVAADKQFTALALAAAGVPVPAGTVRAAHAVWPAAFRRPAIRKRRDGVGGEEQAVVKPDDPLPPPAPHDERIEALAAGVPVGVACICGSHTLLTLPPLEQHFVTAADGGRRYAGGRPLVDPLARSRAAALAERAVRAVVRAAGSPPATGWVGVDMILGARSDGQDDRVLELNPRLTTSFVGLAAGAGVSLVRLMLDTAVGRQPTLSPDWCRPRSFHVTRDHAGHIPLESARR
jgi:predicted ATP-grasp superfamily ATP-dependent carboligase